MVRLLLSAAGAATLIGCDQRSDNAVAIHDAARDLRASGAVVGTDGGEITDAKLKQVAALVQGASTSGTDGEKSSASFILAQTLLAQGEAAAGKAKDIELSARNIMMRINSAAGEWAQRNAVAAAAESLDVSKDLAAMAASKTQKEKDLATERARLATVTKAVEALVAESKAKLAAADAKITQYAQMTQGAAKMTATQSSAAYEQANVLRREGENLRAEGQKIQAHADEQSPLIPEIGLLIDKLDKQIKNLDSTAASLRRRAETAKAEAAEAREGAEKAARDIDERVVELSKLRDTELTPAYDSAISLLRKGATTANAASSQAPGSGKVASGSGQLAVAEAEWAKASNARAFAALMDALAATTPKLPNADDYKSKGAAARKEAEEAIKGATEAFEAAKTALDSGGNRIQRTDVKERLAKLGEDLDKKAKNVTDGIWLDLKAPSAPAPAPSEAAPGAAAAPSTPVDPELLAFLDKYLAAVKGRQADQVAAMTYTSDPALKEAVAVMAGFQKAMFAADSACQAKFNQPVDKVMGSNPMLGMMFQQMGAAKDQLAPYEKLTAADLAVTMESPTKATVALPASPMPVEFVKIEGQWMQGLGAQEAQLKMAAPMMKQLAPLRAVMEAWAADINAGKFADGPAAAADFAAKAMPALQGLMQGGPGGG